MNSFFMAFHVLCLLVIAGIAGESSSRAQSNYYNLFGCACDNENYEYELSDKPIFGDPLLPGRIRNVAQLNDLMNLSWSQWENTIVHNSLVYDDVDHFKVFMEDYQIDKQAESFEDFFENYEVKWSDHCLPPALEYLESFRIGLDQFGMRDKLYLGAAVLEARATVLNQLEHSHKIFEDKLPARKYFNHVVGLTRICVKKRCGCILMDPVYLKKPILVMEDGGLPIEGFNRWFMDNTYQYLDNNKNYIYKKGSDNEKIEYIVYVRRPFCSFLNSVEKFKLLSSTKSIYRIPLNGSVTDGVDFHILSHQFYYKQTYRPNYPWTMAVPFEHLWATRGASVSQDNVTKILQMLGAVSLHYRDQGALKNTLLNVGLILDNHKSLLENFPKYIEQLEATFPKLYI